jgi:hypothetical protein
MPVANTVKSLVTLTLDKEGKVRYHKVCCNCSGGIYGLTLELPGYVEPEGL